MAKKPVFQYREGPARWRTFRSALLFARSLGLKNGPEWRKLGRLRPDDIPSHPEDIYDGKGWKGWGHFLGTGNTTPGRNFRPFEEARHYARSLGLTSHKEWRALRSKRPRDIPANPHVTYAKDGWAGYRDWLGTEFISFAEARIFARERNIRSRADWNSMGEERPINVPSNPEKEYAKKGWKGWPDFLGTYGKHRKYRPFAEARKYARSLKLKTSAEWRRMKHPADIPHEPGHPYIKQGWRGWKDWLGAKGTVSTKERLYRSFKGARRYARSLGLQRSRDWATLGDERPEDIPAAPEKIYRDEGWQGWGDFLGTGNLPTRRKYVSFTKARKYARALRLKNIPEWKEMRDEHPDDIPRSPDKTYADSGWRGWGDFLGTGRLAPGKQVWRSFEDARKFARRLKIKSSSQWLALGERRPKDIPSNPNLAYRGKGWSSWADFLGTNNVALTQKKFRSLKRRESMPGP